MLSRLLLIGLITSLICGFQQVLAQDAAPQAGKGAAAPELPGLLDSRTFELAIVGPDGKGVPNAQFEIRLGPKPEGWIFHRGEPSKRSSRYGQFAEADAEGRASFEIPTTGIKYFAINVTTPGFAPFWAQWDAGQNTAVIPEGYTVHLDAGVTLGGIVVNDEGQPVAGVAVHPSIEFKKREGDLSQLAVGSNLKTDEKGRWVYRSVPAARESLSVRLDHSDYMGTPSLKLPLKEFTVAAGAEPSREMVIPRGETVTGTVTRADGTPIEGARIRTQFDNARRETVTDAQGRYSLKGCRPGRLAIFATAKGQGPDLKTVNVQSNSPSVDFQLPPGKTIRVRLVDAEGKPIPKFRVFFRSWRGDHYGYGLGMELVYANEKGVWEWNEGPADEIVADLCPPNGVQLSDQRLVARDEEYVFKAERSAFTILGAVLDQATGKPIPDFRVVLGEDLGSGRIFWNRPDSFDGKDGKFYYRADYPREGYQFRIEAPGYRPADSPRVAAKDGNAEVLVQLVPGVDVASRVLTAKGDPVVGATVVIGVAGTQIHFGNGELSKSGSYCDQRTTDAEGRFRFPEQIGPFEIIVVHSSGSAWITGAVDEGLKPIMLTPWARVQGTVKAGKEPAGSVHVRLNHEAEQHLDGRPNVSLRYAATTAADGSFGWTRVFPGAGSIGKSIRTHISAGYSESGSHSQRVEFRAEETVKVQIGGTGRAVVGTLRPPASFKEQADWNFAVVRLSGDAANYAAAVQAGGRFRVDDVPAGTYTLTAQLDGAPAGGFIAGERIGTFAREVTVSAVKGEQGAAAVDLGELQLGAP